MSSRTVRRWIVWWFAVLMGAFPLLAAFVIGVAITDREPWQVLRGEFREILFFAIALALLSMTEAAEIIGGGDSYTEAQKTRMMTLGICLAVGLFFYAVAYGGFVASGIADATSLMVAWTLVFDVVVLAWAVALRWDLWNPGG